MIFFLIFKFQRYITFLKTYFLFFWSVTDWPLHASFLEDNPWQEVESTPKSGLLKQSVFNCVVK